MRKSRRRCPARPLPTTAAAAASPPPCHCFLDTAPHFVPHSAGRTAPRPGAAAETFTFGRLPEQGGAAPPAAAAAERNRANFDPDPEQLRWWQQPRNAVTVSGSSNKDIEAWWGSAGAGAVQELVNAGARVTNSACVPMRTAVQTGQGAGKLLWLLYACLPVLHQVLTAAHTQLRSHPSLLQRRRGWAAPSRPAWATPMSFPWRRCAHTALQLALSAAFVACYNCHAQHPAADGRVLG